MVEDVILSVGERAEIYFHGLPGGIIPTPSQVAALLFVRPSKAMEAWAGGSMYERTN